MTGNSCSTGSSAGYLAALLGMFVVLTLEFRSYFQPLLVMIIIPFGFVGAVWGHALLGLPISMLSVFGLVALTGVMVNDSIVLIEFINGHVRDGMPLRHAVVEAGRQRLRPILLNSGTTVIGLFPILLDRSFQAQGVIPMAVSMAFGQLLSLSSSTGTSFAEGNLRSNFHEASGAACRKGIHPGVYIHPDEQVALKLGTAALNVAPPAAAPHRRNAKDKLVVRSDLELSLAPKTKAVLINSPNNPTGKIYDKQTIAGLAQLLDSKSRELGREIYLISDEPYSKIVYDGVTVPSILAAYKNSILITSYSKDLSIPGERLGFIAINPDATPLISS